MGGSACVGLPLRVDGVGRIDGVGAMKLFAPEQQRQSSMILNALAMGFSQRGLVVASMRERTGLIRQSARVLASIYNSA